MPVFKAIRDHSFVLFLAILFLLPAATSCGADKSVSKAGAQVSAVKLMTGIANLEKLLDTAGSRLLVFDLYADWCMPCKILSPMLEKIAAEHGDKATFYKINIDKDPEMSGAFGVQGIPFVVFVRDKVGLDALTGVHPPETYVRTINRLLESSSPASTADPDTPDGVIEKGERIIRLKTQMAPGDLYVYRGDSVRIVFEKVAHPYSIHVPAFKVSAAAETGADLVVTFKADEIGVFPIFCNGDCPVGDGANYGRIIVMQYKGTASTKFTEVTTEEAQKLIQERKPLILDVRTPNEHYEVAITGSTLIPLQQLDGRISEIAKWKNKPVLVYCRSGNRSTVAAQILAREGFTEVYNLRPGMRGWQKSGYATVSSK